MEFIKQGRLSTHELQIIRNDVDRFKSKAVESSIYSGRSGARIDLEVRNSKIWFTTPQESKKTFNILQTIIIENYINFPFNFTNISSIQYANYKTGGHFKWHNDIIHEEPEEGGPALIRSWTMSVNLSNEESYTGGELLVRANKEILTLNKAPGSYVIFPAFIFHQACMVESGERESLVVWVQSTPQEVQNLKKLFKNNTNLYH